MSFFFFWKRQERHGASPWAASAANYVDGAGVAGGSRTILMPAERTNRLSLMPLVRKAQPGMPFPVISSTHGSVTAKDLRDPGKQIVWSSSSLCRTGEAFDHWARRGKGRGWQILYPWLAGVLPRSGWNWQNCHCCSSYSQQSKRQESA